MNTTYAYDTYGNRTSVATYAGAGSYTSGTTSYSAPGGGSAARTTTTGYDTTFHAFAAQETNPLGHTTRADYDYRIGTLIRVTGWDAENRAASVSSGGVAETYTYDAEGERVTKTRQGVTTFYLEGLWEEQAGGATQVYYPFNGQVIALRDSGTNAVTYLHGDHLGSISASTTSGGALLSSQEFDPWGQVRPGGGIPQTSLNYTSQRLDATGLLYYHVRYYDPALARFVSADSAIPNPSNPQQKYSLKMLSRILIALYKRLRENLKTKNI